MWKIGVTGSIGTGKSTLLEAFSKADVPVFSADQAVAELYAGDAVAPVETLFPGVSKGGVVDRQELTRRLASDPTGFKRLEAVVHPLVRARIAEFCLEAEKAGAVAAAVEVPLLFESGYDYGFDAIAVTHVDDAIQRERVMARPGMTVEKLETLLARQMPQAEKKARATYLFDTGRKRAEIEDMVSELVDGIRARQKIK
ncbi:dephospho-CoA kinase [Devosia rhizoryzae]|uniref:Dephospho-CoA kinase n=1 Tax=Devosia rhizoryzae TaxID=2774137 RepID=A0ABX7C4F0_9HYPH|nr:dephospho-CoA kinase [Devosia rhizoryzae]QQR39105.1 dephospho-CoA kinase [Devosia rhizoryzae]